MPSARIEELADRIRGGAEIGLGELSSGERAYVALATNRPDLLYGESILSALRSLTPDWLHALLNRY